MNKDLYHLFLNQTLLLSKLAMIVSSTYNTLTVFLALAVHLEFALKVKSKGLMMLPMLLVRQKSSNCQRTEPEIMIIAVGMLLPLATRTFPFSQVLSLAFILRPTISCWEREEKSGHCVMTSLNLISSMRMLFCLILTKEWSTSCLSEEYSLSSMYPSSQNYFSLFFLFLSKIVAARSVWTAWMIVGQLFSSSLMQVDAFSMFSWTQSSTYRR